MKLLLCSEGFHTPNTVQKAAELIGKPVEQISFAVINEAYAQETDNLRWVLHNLNAVADNFGGEHDLVDLLALPIDEVEARIMAKDGIFVVGGHTDWLMHVFAKTGFTKLLPKLLETKLYVGSSAGSMVAGRRISTEAYSKIYGESNDFGVTEYMNLVNLGLKPHLDSEHFVNNREDKLRSVVDGVGFPVYALRDDSAIVVDGDNVYTIGSDPIIFNATKS